ncbi:glycoside hydrolase family 23 protein [Amanita rubescens]|nr:glycoside hydrolase family 23 protein [Amanita rubescens]
MVPTLFFTLFAALLSLSTAFPHDLSSLSSRHNRLARPAESRQASKRCQNNNDTAQNDGVSHVNMGAGLIKVTSSTCGPTGATKKSTSTSGPNGSIYWLNCGITNGGWKAPFVRVQDLVSRDLRSVINNQNNVFKPCAPYLSQFEKYANMYGFPSILLASFAMQESSCIPDAVGGGGEQGLMQISKDKCSDAPNGDCKNPDYNIGTAAKFFHGLLASNNGNVLVCIGSYNGWFEGMTYNDATAAAKSKCCRCQENLAYIHQFVNGWLQGIDAHDDITPPEEFDNLRVCSVL